MNELATIWRDIAQFIPQPPRPLIEITIDRRGGACVSLLGASNAQFKVENQRELRASLAKMRNHCARAPHLQLRLAPQSYLIREMRLPASAKNQVWPILDLDLKRGTPFGPEQVYQGCHIHPERSSGEVNVNHIVVKRRQLDPILNTVRAEDYHLLPRIKLLRNEGDFELELRPSVSAPGPKRLVLNRLRSITAVTAIASILVLLGLLYWRQMTALSELSLRMESTKERAMIVRTKLSELERDMAIFSALQEAYEQRPSVITILGELTELVPDGAWLTELNLEPDAIILTGHAKSSVNILVAFEASPLFGRARFASPVIRVPGDSVERFSIRLELQSSGKLSFIERNEP